LLPILENNKFIEEIRVGGAKASGFFVSRQWMSTRSLTTDWGVTMTRIVSALAALVFSATSALAAGPSPWDVAFGAGVMSDYNFRGISQSALKWSGTAYLEPRYNINPNLQLYTGVAYQPIRFPNDAKSEFDFYGGIRPTFGKLGLDFGVWYYWYPGGTCYNSGVAGCSATLANGNVIKKDLSFWEVYSKATYAPNDVLTLGANLFYSPSWLNSGAPGTYLSGTTKLALPSHLFPKDAGAYLSGEIGYYWLGTTDAFYGTINLPDYATWNIGIAFTYKAATLDLRYYDTNLSKVNCNTLSSDHTATISPSGVESKWCGAAFVAKFSIDLTSANLK